MPDELDEQPYRDAIVAAVEAWLEREPRAEVTHARG